MTRHRKGGMTLLVLTLLAHAAGAKELHVSLQGNDDSEGSLSRPLRTISAAARLAQPGDVITVHEGTYRERVAPPRGGTSDTARIVYQAAPGETVFIKGSEVVRGWRPFASGVWKLTLPLSFFGNYNPYRDLIAGDWFLDRGRPHHTGEVFLNGKSLFESHLLERVLHPQPLAGIRDREGSTWTWFTESDDQNTYIYANFHNRNPNEETVEITVRDSCFYPDQPGRNYISVRGFRLSQAATQWAAPTAEQIGLIGTHWSKGWIIENNVISDSKCVGISLGKDRKTGHNVWSKNPGKDGATHYNEVIVRALAAGWSRENIGSHIVRNNTIFNCEQAGIVGSLGAVYSRISRNHIYNIWTKRQFGGAEMGGIKIHGAIDVVIEHNRVHNTDRGIWMDWMAQGTRITANLVYDSSSEDLFLEVDHGPYVVDNNLLLSAVSLVDISEGGAYAHNLIAGAIDSRVELTRSTPFHQAHATALAGLSPTRGGDNRFYNNILVAGAGPGGKPAGVGGQQFRGFGLWVYDTREAALQTGGNVYYNGARPYRKEQNPVAVSGAYPLPRVEEEGDSVYLQLSIAPEALKAPTKFVTTALLGKAKTPGLAYETADSSHMAIDHDYFGQLRSEESPTAGPFEQLASGESRQKVW